MTSLPVPLLQGFVSAATWMVFSLRCLPWLARRLRAPRRAFATAFFWLVSHPRRGTPTAPRSQPPPSSSCSTSKIHKLFPSALVCCVLGCLLAFNGIDIGACVGAITVDVSTLWPPAALSIPGELAKALLVPVWRWASSHTWRCTVCRFWADNDGEVGQQRGSSRGRGEHLQRMAGGMNVAGVISRSSFGITAGAKTRLAHFVTGCVSFSSSSLAAAPLPVLPKAAIGRARRLRRPASSSSRRSEAALQQLRRNPEGEARLHHRVGLRRVHVHGEPTLDIGLYRGAAFACAIFLLEKVYAKAQKAQEESDAAGR